MRSLYLKLRHLVLIWWRSLTSVDLYAVLRCPACGLIFTSVPNSTDFSTPYGKVMCKCPRCTATWAQDPIVEHLKWKVESLDEVNAKRELKLGEQLKAMAEREQKLGIKR